MSEREGEGEGEREGERERGRERHSVKKQLLLSSSELHINEVDGGLMEKTTTAATLQGNVLPTKYINNCFFPNHLKLGRFVALLFG